MDTNAPRPPGERIKDELKARGWTQADLATILGRPLPSVNEVIAGKRSITPETALQLGTAFGTDAEMWMQLEAQYRLSLIDRDGADVERRARLFSYGPIKEMEKRGWIKPTASVDDLENELCSFYGVTSLDQEPQIDAMPRKSLAGEALNPAQKAWCFRARQLATCMTVKSFDLGRLDNAVKKLRELAAYPEEARRTSRVLAAAGVRFVVVEPLSKTRIDGAAFWLDKQSPIIALSIRYDRIDSFWHTLGHELSHVRHLDSAPPVDTDLVGDNRIAIADLSNVEIRADRESAATWIDPKELESFIVRVGPLFSKARINQFANRIRIHPGIIVGQLQYRGQLGYASNREMLVKVREKVVAETLTDGWGHSITGN